MKNKEYIISEILRCYAIEDNSKLSKRLSISESYLRVKAKRLGVKKITTTKSNKIINGKKRCACCRRFLPVDTSFRNDKYQPLGKDYYQVGFYCKECRLKKAKEKQLEEVKKTQSIKANGGFGVKKTRNPIVIINGIEHLKCKGFCKEYKPLSEYYTASGNTNGVMNFCKTCYLENKRLNREKARKKSLR